MAQAIVTLEGAVAEFVEDQAAAMHVNWNGNGNRRGHSLEEQAHRRLGSGPPGAEKVLPAPPRPSERRGAAA